MLVKALVRDVVHGGNAGKVFAQVTLETTNPLEIMSLRLFEASFTDGTVKRFEEAAKLGKVIDVPLSSQVYKGNLQFQFPYNQTLVIPQPSLTVKTA